MTGYDRLTGVHSWIRQKVITKMDELVLIIAAFGSFHLRYQLFAVFPPCLTDQDYAIAVALLPEPLEF
jgi:hypothetical protein